MFASCANSSDSNSDDKNPSPSLPANVGENPITKTIKLICDGYRDSYLELEPDGTALYAPDDKETSYKFKYAYDVDAKKIYMIVEKAAYYNDWNDEEEWYQLLSYDEIRYKINKDFTTEKIRQLFKDMYEREKDDEYYKDEYANYNSYDDYENELVKEAGVGSFDAYVKYVKLGYENKYKATFGAQIAYAYEIKNGKMTLTEKFTGVKNLLSSRCRFDNESSYGDIDCYGASIRFREDDVYYAVIPNTEKKTISFVPDGGGEKVNATYTENIAQETVTISFNGEEYVCKFYGRIFTQE